MTTTPAPNDYRRVLAKIFAECEDRGLGTWSPQFQAHPGREDEAADYIEARAEHVFAAEMNR